MEKVSCTHVWQGIDNAVHFLQVVGAFCAVECEVVQRVRDDRDCLWYLQNVWSVPFTVILMKILRA